jgi:hypothetical protein
VVDEPVEVRRRTVRRYEEVSEPSVSVTRRTSIHTRDTSPSVGVSVEQRRSPTNTSSRVNSSNSVSTTGSVSTRGNAGDNAKSHQGGATATKKLPIPQQGGSSTQGSNSTTQ